MRQATVILFFAAILVLSVTSHAGIITVGTSGETYPGLQLAVDAAVDGDTIRISAGTYTSDQIMISGKTNLTIEAASGAAVTLKQKTPLSATDGFVRIHHSTNVTLRGDSPSKRLVLQNQGNVNTLDASMWNENQNITIEKIEFSGTQSGFFTVIAGGTEVFNNCKWNGTNMRALQLNGVDTQPLADVTLNDCVISPTGADYTIMDDAYNSKLTLNRCTVDNTNAAGTNYGVALNEANSTQTLQVTDCTFRKMHLVYDDSGTGVVDGSKKQIIFTNPVFENVTGGIQSYKGASVTLQGKDAQHKADLATSSPAVWFVNIVKGALTLQDVITAPSQGLGIVAAVAGPTNSPVTINLNRCIFANGTQLADNGTAGGSSTVTINAVNCIFQGSIRPFFDTNSTVKDTINLTHCTMYPLAGSTGLDYLMTGANDVLTARYCIFDADGQNSVASAIPLGGSKNIVREASFLTFGGAGMPGDTIKADPKLDATGHLLSGSPALNVATGSTTTVDIDGNARPSGTAADIGADEFNEGPRVNAVGSMWSIY